MPDPTLDTRLGSFAAVLADELPDTWTSTWHPGRGGDNDHQALTDHVWGMNDVADALARHTVDHCAVLSRDDGIRLFVADPLGHGEGYLTVDMAPVDAPAEAFRGVREPEGIAVAADPFSAAEDITHDLLPRYDKAIAQVRSSAARLTAPQAADPERVVMIWSGDALIRHSSSWTTSPPPVTRAPSGCRRRPRRRPPRGGHPCPTRDPRPCG
ncbi:hypothetical protein [Streptomyces sp. NPDC001657]|uniref:hypothetical protein n=1 Tax=Streptomyces sp. NPDC001657 TaxID=3154522 RepID=UPI0033306782